MILLILWAIIYRRTIVHHHWDASRQDRQTDKEGFHSPLINKECQVRTVRGDQTESLVISTIRLVSLWNKMKAQSTKLHLWLYKINIQLYQKIVKLPNGRCGYISEEHLSLLIFHMRVRNSSCLFFHFRSDTELTSGFPKVLVWLVLKFLYFFKVSLTDNPEVSIQNQYSTVCGTTWQ